MGWESARRIRELVAWILLIVATIGLVIGAWTLFGLPGSPFQNWGIAVSGGIPFPPSITPFTVRAAAALQTFGNSYSIFAPVFAVLLVAVGGVTRRAAYVTLLAAALQTCLLGLSLCSLAVGLGIQRPVWYFLTQAQPVVLAAGGLTLTVAILRRFMLRDAARRRSVTNGRIDAAG